MTEAIVKFFVIAVWLIALVGAAIYALMVFFAILSVVDGFGALLVTIVFVVFVCQIINIFKRM